uniref:HTH CENPB-type domain-containing protein n=1 Tax=Glossina austeni TaxID=7395 RepID=A0A1A9UVQ8_GLOAU
MEKTPIAIYGSYFCSANLKLLATYSMASPNDYRTRNILSLEERVQVCKEYERLLSLGNSPSYQSLAKKFECSSKQIKNILLNKNNILQSFENYNPDAPCKDEIQQRRKEKIEFLGKVMYEYLERAVYNGFSITEQKVRWKAVEVKECIAVENFNLTDAWLAHFQKLYNIPSFDLDALRNNMCISEAKRPYLNAIDMIQYVSRKEQQQLKDAAEQNDMCSNDNSMSEGQEETNEGTRIVYVNDENDDDDDDNNDREVNNKFNNLSQQHINGQPLEKITGSLKRSLSPLPDIESVEDALRHIKALEEYSMLRDNYRAIGLLTQLEDIFKKQIRKM